MLSSEWYSRKVDDLDLPTEILIHYRHYKEALKILKAIVKKEYCSYDLCYVYFDMAICYFNLGKYSNAEKYFDMVVSDDEDYADIIRPYRQKLKKLKK